MEREIGRSGNGEMGFVDVKTGLDGSFESPKTFVSGSSLCPLLLKIVSQILSHETLFLSFFLKFQASF